MKALTVIFIGKLDKVMVEKDPVRRVVDIQTGRRFRSLAAKSETFAEKKVAKTLDTGVLQPDFLTHILWGEAMLDQLDTKSHLLIDGFPRTVTQAHVLEDALTFFERNNIHVINLETPQEVVRARMEGRARTDDTKESIEERLRWYREDTLPVLNYYRARGDIVVHDIDGMDTIEGVHVQILKALNLA
jgi:adenylate kinase